MENDNNKVGIFVTAFIAIIIGVVLLGSLADTIYDSTNTRESVNETITFSDTLANISNTTNTAQNDITSVTNFINLTGSDFTANIDTTVNWTRAGVITIDRETVGYNNTFNITYDFESDNYIAHGVSRTLITLLIIFFALGVLATAVWAMYKMGIMDMLR